MTHRITADRRGMTLLEMLLALIVFGVIVGGAFNVMRQQSKGYRLGSEQMDELQNLRFAANMLELDLRTAGSNVPDEQPFLIYAGSNVVAFNADYATNVEHDVWAVYYDADAPAGTVMALTKARQITLPLTSFVYPDTSYRALGGLTNSPAETIVFYFESDAATARTDDYILYQKVNADAAEVVSRNLLQTPGEPFFVYYWIKNPPSAPAHIEEVPADALPLSHSTPIHGSTADTGAVALIDSVRAVRVNFTATNGKTGAEERQRAISRLVRLPNAGLAVKRSCGDEPILGIGLTAVGVTLGTGEPAVNLTWSQAIDEAGGESDVTRYVIWRRQAAQPDWGEPYLSIPSGQATYSYQDLDVTSGDQYYYALAVQDCTPTLSGQAQSALVTVP
jgi:prepilin-type N-terminal cleavage/methylation domain-containing protein